jgi:26S proteasome regulatory subunit T3
MTMIDSIQDDDDLYAQLKGLQRQEEFLDIQEEYIKDEMRNLKRELIRAREVSALLIN